MKLLEPLGSGLGASESKPAEHLVLQNLDVDVSNLKGQRPSEHLGGRGYRSQRKMDEEDLEESRRQWGQVEFPQSPNKDPTMGSSDRKTCTAHGDRGHQRPEVSVRLAALSPG